MASNTSRKILYIGSLSFFVILLLLIGIYLIETYKINKEYYRKYNSNSDVTLRNFPYPYRAALAISSDIDNTETLDEFLELHKFLNTNEPTSMGEGIGLEIGSSFLFYEPPAGAISYFQGGPQVAETIRKFIQAGYIDVMHSYGKKADFSRKDAVVALRELENIDRKIDVWVDHTKSMDNFGDDVTLGLGDHPTSKAYHADLTLANGIKFVWLGRVTMIIGQSTPITIGTFTSIYDSEHPFCSLINICKECLKNILAVFGNKKYAIHRDNDLIKVTKLDDGQKIYEFLRFDNYWQGVGLGASNKGLAYVISKKTLERLKKTEGYMIVYTHLGKNSDCQQYFCNKTQEALRNLFKEFEKGNIYISKTSNLLNYYIRHKYLDWSYETRNGEISIHIYRVNDPVFGAFIPRINDLEGITFYVPDNKKVTIYLNNEKIKRFRKNREDYTGRNSVTITLKTATTREAK